MTSPSDEAHEERRLSDEAGNLLDRNAPPIHETEHQNLTWPQARGLYLSHTLSTWNARTYEFAAILFTAEAFRGTLLANSIRGLVTTLATLLLSSYVGAAIDRSSDRLRPLVLSITLNRASVFLACLVWSVLLSEYVQGSRQVAGSLSFSWLEVCLFTAVVCIGVVEKLSGVANMLSMERDWVPALADPPSGTSSGSFDLTRLNSVMRRIDLVCKLIAPLAISFLIEMTSMVTGVVVIAVMSLTCCGIEVLSATYVWHRNSRLHEPKILATSRSNRPAESGLAGFIAAAQELAKAQWQRMKTYFTTPQNIWVVSIALAILHFSSLSYSATFITYLLNSGFSLLLITVARTLGSVVEVSSTFIAPFGIRRLAQTRQKRQLGLNEEDYGEDMEDTSRIHSPDTAAPDELHIVGLARSGLWGTTFQLTCLVPVVLAIAQISSIPDLSAISKSTWVYITLPMFAFLSLSRLGLWVYDLVATEITQLLIPRLQRSSFAGTEMSFVAFFELLQWIAAIIWSRPQDFVYLALTGFTAVAVSTVMVAVWVRQRRGHLIHWDRLAGCTSKCGNG